MNRLQDLAKRLSSKRWLPNHLDLMLPGIVLSILAVGVLVLTIHKGLSVANAIWPVQKSASGNEVEVQRIYLAQTDYLEYAPTLGRLNPGVAFATSQADGTLTLSIVNEEMFPDLMMALHTMQSFKPGVAWEMVELCVRTCPDKAVAQVAVKGFKQEMR